MEAPRAPSRVKGMGIVDLLIATLLASVTAGYAWVALGNADPRFLRLPDGEDVWFEADVPTVSNLMLHRWHDHGRNVRHPLFPLASTAPIYALKAVGFDDGSALRVFVGATAAVWSAALYVLMLGLTRRRADAVLFTAVGHVTAAAVFWLPVPETYTLGSISIMAALALGAWDDAARVPVGWYTAAVSASLAITSSNWASGSAVLVPRFAWRRSVQIAANSLCVVALLWAVQHRFVPSVPFFLGSDVQSRFVMVDGIGGIPEKMRALLVHAIVMPRIAIEPNSATDADMLMTVQQSGLGSSGTTGAAATLLWVTLLLLGVWGLAVVPRTVGVALGLAVAAHIAVYMVYGDETFLYSLHVAPLLVGMAATSTRTKARGVALFAAAVLFVLLTVNNVQALVWAAGFFEYLPR